MIYVSNNINHNIIAMSLHGKFFKKYYTAWYVYTNMYVFIFIDIFLQDPSMFLPFETWDYQKNPQGFSDSGYKSLIAGAKNITNLSPTDPSNHLQYIDLSELSPFTPFLPKATKSLKFFSIFLGGDSPWLNYTFGRWGCVMVQMHPDPIRVMQSESIKSTHSRTSNKHRNKTVGHINQSETIWSKILSTKSISKFRTSRVLWLFNLLVVSNPSEHSFICSIGVPKKYPHHRLNLSFPDFGDTSTGLAWGFCPLIFAPELLGGVGI